MEKYIHFSVLLETVALTKQFSGRTATYCSFSATAELQLGEKKARKPASGKPSSKRKYFNAPSVRKLKLSKVKRMWMWPVSFHIPLNVSVVCGRHIAETCKFHSVVKNVCICRPFESGLTEHRSWLYKMCPDTNAPAWRSRLTTLASDF